jgi:flagellar protein FliS
MSWQLKKNYLEAEVLTAHPVRLVEITFDIAVTALEGARECCKAGDIAGRSRFVNKAFEVLAELTESLNYAAGKELADNYARLYDYCQRRLLQANAEQSEPMLFEVESLLRELREAWQVVAANQSAVCLSDEELDPDREALTEPEPRFSFVG